jgi:hypothetical protein
MSKDNRILDKYATEEKEKLQRNNTSSVDIGPFNGFGRAISIKKSPS